MGFRKEKLEELIKRIVSDMIIKREVKDPRIGFTTITGVKLSDDYSTAKIGVSVLGEPKDLRKTLEGLNSAVGFIQYKVGKSIKTRVTPKIEFFLDSSIVDGSRIINIINGLVKDETEEGENRDNTDE